MTENRREQVLALMKEEGNRHEWIHKESKYPCIIARSPTTGAWCGYVQLPEDHPFFNLGYDDVEEMEDADIKVHGGLTFGERGCFGFDCSHAFDYYPMMGMLGGFNQFATDFINHHEQSMSREQGVTYKTKQYAMNEVDKLAKQFYDCRDF